MPIICCSCQQPTAKTLVCTQCRKDLRTLFAASNGTQDNGAQLSANMFQRIITFTRVHQGLC